MGLGTEIAGCAAYVDAVRPKSCSRKVRSARLSPMFMGMRTSTSMTMATDLDLIATRIMPIMRTPTIMRTTLTTIITRMRRA